MSYDVTVHFRTPDVCEDSVRGASLGGRPLEAVPMPVATSAVVWQLSSTSPVVMTRSRNTTNPHLCAPTIRILVVITLSFSFKSSNKFDWNQYCASVIIQWTKWFREPNQTCWNCNGFKWNIRHWKPNFNYETIYIWLIDSFYCYIALLDRTCANFLWMSTWNEQQQQMAATIMVTENDKTPTTLQVRQNTNYAKTCGLYMAFAFCTVICNLSIIQVLSEVDQLLWLTTRGTTTEKRKRSTN